MPLRDGGWRASRSSLRGSGSARRSGSARVCLSKSSSTRSSRRAIAAAGLRRDGDDRRAAGAGGARAAARTSSISISAMSHFERTTSVEHCALRATSATARSWSTSALARVDEDERDVGRARPPRARAAPSSTRSPAAGVRLRRSPAVSTRTNVRVAALEARCRSRRASCPACSETITRSSPSSAFRRLDLPTFGRPRIATRIASSPTCCAAARPGAASTIASSRSPVPWPCSAEIGIGSPRPSRWNSSASASCGGVVDLVREQRAPACARARRIAASSSSPGVIPACASTTNRTRSASAIAARAWSAIERVIGDAVGDVDAAGVDQQEALPVPLADELLAVARHARRLVDDGRARRRSAG